VRQYESKEGEVSVYKHIGIEPILNLAGAGTRLGGPLMNPRAAQAMLDASRECVLMDELQGRASELIASATGAEAGYVTSGAGAALTLAGAACLARLDFAKMNQLPDTRNMRSEIVISREHRSGYDHALRASGAKLIEVGMNEISAGAGVRRTEVWEYDAAISDQTAAVAFVYNATSKYLFQDVLRLCQSRGVPVIVDAAAQLPPRQNLRSLIESGADLVAFSGGKAIRGPQGTGVLAGKFEFIMSAALQNLDLDEHWSLWNPPKALIDKSLLTGLPRHGIGRGFKVSKEQVVGLLVALEDFSDGSYVEEVRECGRLVTKVAASLVNIEDVSVEIVSPFPEDGYATLEIHIDESMGCSAFDIVRDLRACSPPIYVGEKFLPMGRLVINSMNLSDESTNYLIDQLMQILAR
jgi:L-seryl-tRNA(Ser) seleniumtransferase